MRYLITVNNRIRSDALAADARARHDLYHLISGVTPSELPDDTDLRNANPQRKRGPYLSPPEYCCVLSHARALDKVIGLRDDCAMICEDDITIDEGAVAANALRLAGYLNGNTIIIIGCQQGMKFGAYFRLRARLTTARLFLPERRVIYRAACYMLDYGAARKLHAIYGRSPKCVADDWYYIARETGLEFRFTDGATHPRDGGDSYLEATRHGKK